jgi:hypothetical protein
MNLTTSQIRSDVGLAVALRISISRLARRIRAERTAKDLPELSHTQFASLCALVRHPVMMPGELVLEKLSQS